MVKMIFLQILIFLAVIYFCQAEPKLLLSATLHSTPLSRYLFYKDAVVSYLTIPENVAFASFQFRSYEESNSRIFSKCAVRNVTVYLKANAPAVVNPDGAKFPELFVKFARDPMNVIVFKTDNQTNYINITVPPSHSYFITAFLNYKDPKQDKIQQQGLHAVCRAFLITDLYVKIPKNIVFLTPNTNFKVNVGNPDETYKLYVPDNIAHILITIKPSYLCSNCTKIIVKLQAENAPLVSSATEFNDLKMNGTYVIKFFPKEESWHYIYFSAVNLEMRLIINWKYIMAPTSQEIDTRLNNLNITHMNNSYFVQKYYKKDLSGYIFNEYKLIKFGQADPFQYDFDIQPITGDKDFPLYVNVSNRYITTLKYDITSPMDIGGTLTFGIAIAPEILIRNQSKSTTNSSTFIVCMRKDVKEIPTWPDKCVFEDSINDALAVLTVKNDSQSFLIPYPEIGRWYITIKLFCGQCSSCKCSNECDAQFQNCTLNCEVRCTNATNCSSCAGKCKSEILKNSECENCDCNEACAKDYKVCEDNVVFSINSLTCIHGGCSKLGRCSILISEGFAYSTCICRSGHRGWDCTDVTMSDSAFIILISLLLLTLSNLFFIPTIYFAFKRDYVIEAVVYCFTMTFSILYHSCDADEESGVCIMPLAVLQFCDFYCGLFGIWVTLIAMSYLPQKITSICHTCGAILLACATALDKVAFWVFLVPVLIGILLFCIIWGLQCKKRNTVYPGKRYLKVYFPIGIIVAVFGLTIYGFLQTRQNYKYLHSLWHITIAISVLFLLPDKKYLR